jgi:EAL domain-containing protein (putative c-di-GMP-specific phosphodiesterase class I)
MGQPRYIDFDSQDNELPVPVGQVPSAYLGDALRRSALSLQFQPQFDLATGGGCGLEALARWTLPSGTSVAPSMFIPIAERSGMIHALGAWVLQAACDSACSYCGRDGQTPMLSVNVSALQVNRDFCSVIEECLKRTGFPAEQLVLEITESALMAETALTISYLTEWKELGVRIALDDFGTGYSSLNYLGKLPVDRLKVDQSLVHRITNDRRSAIVLRSILALGADLGLEVIAEGIETEQQLQMLTDFGCPQAQGYLLGRPMSARQAQVTLRRAWGNRPARSFQDRTAVVGECSVQ